MFLQASVYFYTLHKIDWHEIVNEAKKRMEAQAIGEAKKKVVSASEEV